MNQLLGVDRLAGLIFILLGASFLWLGLDFGFGTMSRIGSGFFPVILALLLTAIGLAVFVKSFISDEGVVLPGFGPMTRVLIAMAIFAGFMQSIGSYVILPIVVVLAASASPHFRWRAAVMLALGVTLCSDLVFRIALGLPLHAIGYWFGG